MLHKFPIEKQLEVCRKYALGSGIEELKDEYHCQEENHLLDACYAQYSTASARLGKIVQERRSTCEVGCDSERAGRKDSKLKGS